MEELILEAETPPGRLTSSGGFFTFCMYLRTTSSGFLPAEMGVGGRNMSQEGWGQALGSRWGRDRKEVVKGELRASRDRCLLGPKSSGIVFRGSHGAYFS